MAMLQYARAEEVPAEYADQVDRVAESFAGRTILLTGATGLIGKVLIDKLLRCAPKVERIYLLVRPKRGVEPAERVRQLFENHLYDLLKSIDESHALRKKCVAIAGDVAAPALGLSAADRELLAAEVEIVYHAAASVRFDEPMARIATLNVRGTHQMLELAREMHRLRLFVYVSTAYAHLSEPHVEERMYAPPMNPHYLLRMLEMFDADMIDSIGPSLLKDYPNNYSFTKALAEGLVNEELANGNLPVMIARPSVVIPIYRYPLPGWVDNLNGPVGLMIAAGKGVMRTVHMPRETNADFIPVDVCVNALCTATYGYLNYPEHRESISVINITTSSLVKKTWDEIIAMARELAQELPFNWIAWYPGGYITRSKWLHTCNLYLKQLLPAVCGDALLRCFHYPPVLMKIQRRILTGYEIFDYYLNNQWEFSNARSLQLREELLNDKEKAIYVADLKGFDADNYFRTCMRGARRYLLKESDDTLPTARRFLKVMWVVDKLFHLFLLYLLWNFVCYVYNFLF